MRVKSFIMCLFFNDTATTEIYTLSLHDALPILSEYTDRSAVTRMIGAPPGHIGYDRSEEHTSELQSHVNLVCRLLLEKKNSIPIIPSAVQFDDSSTGLPSQTCTVRTVVTHPSTI